MDDRKKPDKQSALAGGAQSSDDVREALKKCMAWIRSKPGDTIQHSAELLADCERALNATPPPASPRIKRYRDNTNGKLIEVDLDSGEVTDITPPAREEVGGQYDDLLPVSWQTNALLDRHNDVLAYFDASTEDDVKDRLVALINSTAPPRGRVVVDEVRLAQYAAGVLESSVALDDLYGKHVRIVVTQEGRDE